MSPLPLELEVSGSYTNPSSPQERTISISRCLSGPEDDYEPVSEPLTLMPGLNSRACVDVVINNDLADEADEIFIIDLTLLSPHPTTIITTDVVIFDDGEQSVV